MNKYILQQTLFVRINNESVGLIYHQYQQLQVHQTNIQTDFLCYIRSR